MTVAYRPAQKGDEGQILNFVRELAEYEKLLHEVKATDSMIDQSLFGPSPKAFAYLAYVDNTPAGFVLCFYNYSTFNGQAGIFIEDLYVQPEYRGKGIGKGFFRVIAERAVTENCGRIEWSVLDWNEPSIAFYKKLGAVPMDEWTVMRLHGDTITEVARQERKAA